MNVENQRFRNERVMLDNHHYIRCTFDDCDLVFTGTGQVGLTGNELNNCRWLFDGPAAQTLAFLKGLYHGGGRDLVEAWISDVRRPGR